MKNIDTRTQRTDREPVAGLDNRTVVGLFPRLSDARLALEALYAERDFDRGSISLIANDSDKRFSRYLGKEDIRDNDEHYGLMDKLKNLVSLRDIETIPGIGRVLISGPIERRLSIGDDHSRYDVLRALGTMGIPSREAGLYAEGVRRGGALILVEVGSRLVDRAVALLDRFNPVDLEHTSGHWRQSGWSQFDTGRKPLGLTELEKERMLFERQHMTGTTGTTTRAATSGKVGKTERIPIVEEDVVIGKRDVQGGGVRIRAFPVEKPVHETVTLREEHVHVERHPTDRQLSREEADRVFRNQTIEMVEHSEEAVVGKKAHIVEEIEVSKDFSTRQQTINETERHTEVQVERLGRGVDRVAFDTVEPEFRRHFDTTYGTKSGFKWDGGMRDAYRLGYESGYDPRFGNDWTTSEKHLSSHWSKNYGHYGAWDRFKDAVRHGWMRAKAKV